VAAAAKEREQLEAQMMTDGNENLPKELPVEKATNKNDSALDNDFGSSRTKGVDALTVSAHDIFSDLDDPVSTEDVLPDDPILMLEALVEEAAATVAQAPKRATTKPRFKAKPRAVPRKR
jgi:hypothetical protein